MESHFAFGSGLGGSVGGDELFDGVEDDLELLVVLGVFLFEGFDLFGEQAVGIHQTAELDEGAHDGDVHLYGTRRTEDT